MNVTGAKLVVGRDRSLNKRGTEHVYARADDDDDASFKD